MMDKVALATALGYSAGGSRPIYMAEDERGVKIASPDKLLPSVRAFLSSVDPEPGTRYVLVNAMGAYEYWGPNSNHDAWPEAALCHLPPGWSGDPSRDKPLVQIKKWPYGLPTFYFAHAFVHHRNKDPNKKVGDVVLAEWNDTMKRVELVLRVEERLCHAHGGSDFWYRMENGEFPAVSMGAKVPWDRCSVSTDLNEFYHALSTFNPAEHQHPGIAVLRYHERKIKERGYGIPGIARTRAEYGDPMKYNAGGIDKKTGKKVFVFNDFPKFFDISLVRIGADKTAYSMISLGYGGGGLSKIAASVSGNTLDHAKGKLKNRVAHSLDEVFKTPMGGSTLSEAFQADSKYPLEVHFKSASSPFDQFVENLLGSHQKAVALELSDPEPFWKEAELILEAPSSVKKAYHKKRGEIQKEIDGLVTHVTQGESELPQDCLDRMADTSATIPQILGSGASLGIVFRPQEFLRICLRKMLGDGDLAEGLELPMPPRRECPPMGLSMLPSLLSMLCPYFSMRSGFDEPLRTRITVMIVRPSEEKRNFGKASSSLPDRLLDKLGSLYQSYRSGLMDFLPVAPYLIEGVGDAKIAHLKDSEPEDLFSPLSYRYFDVAYTNASPHLSGRRD